MPIPYWLYEAVVCYWTLWDVDTIRADPAFLTAGANPDASLNERCTHDASQSGMEENPPGLMPMLRTPPF